MNQKQSRHLHTTADAYRRAIADARDESLPNDAREQAGEEVIRLRLELDDTVIAAIESEEARAVRDSAVRLRGPAGRAADGGPSGRELRDFVTPGSATTQLWVTPPREIVVGSPNQFAQRTASPYLTSDTATVGSAYYFTTDLYQNVVMGLLDASGILEAQPTMIVTNHIRPIQVPVLQVDAVAAAGTEGSAATQTNTEGDKVELGAFRYDGKFAISVEMLMASEYNLAELLSTYATRAVANKTAAMLALGNGTTEPQGLFTASAVTVGVTAAGTTTATMDEVLQTTKALGKGYRKVAKLVTSDVLHTEMLLTKQDDGDYLLDSTKEGGYTFARKPWFVEPQADQTSMSAGEVHAVYGDFASGYFVRTTPMFLQRTDGDDPLNPQFHFAIWMDAKVADANALVSLKLHS